MARGDHSMASEIYDMESCVRFWMAGSGWGRCPGRAAVGKVRGQELPSRPTCDGVGTGILEHEPVPVAQLGQQNVLVDAVGAVTGRAPHLRRQAGGFRGRGKCVCVGGNADSVAAGARNTSPTERRGHKGGGGHERGGALGDPGHAAHMRATRRDITAATTQA